MRDCLNRLLDSERATADIVFEAPLKDPRVHRVPFIRTFGYTAPVMHQPCLSPPPHAADFLPTAELFEPLMDPARLGQPHWAVSCHLGTLPRVDCGAKRPASSRTQPGQPGPGGLVGKAGQ